MKIKKQYEPVGMPKVKFPKPLNPEVRSKPKPPKFSRVTDLRKFIK